jgi:hypothetical protein
MMLLILDTCIFDIALNILSATGRKNWKIQEK